LTQTESLIDLGSSTLCLAQLQTECKRIWRHQFPKKRFKDAAELAVLRKSQGMQGKGRGDEMLIALSLGYFVAA